MDPLYCAICGATNPVEIDSEETDPDTANSRMRHKWARRGEAYCTVDCARVGAIVHALDQGADKIANMICESVNSVAARIGI